MLWVVSVERTGAQELALADSELGRYDPRLAVGAHLAQNSREGADASKSDRPLDTRCPMSPAITSTLAIAVPFRTVPPSRRSYREIRATIGR